MKGPVNSPSGRACLALAAFVLAVAVPGCGSGEDGAGQLARQEELRAAREEAARDARQSTRIAELERKLRRADRQVPAAVAGPGPGSSEAAAASESPETVGAPLAGLWKGEAVIRYDSGESDPFRQTIEIDSLVPGEVVGYSEATQGSTTCHGPLTYEGVSGGWYQFSAEERNVAECIDFSEVELMPQASGDLVYRETTEVSVSNGTLVRVRQ